MIFELVKSPLVAWCFQYVAQACTFVSRRGPITCVRPPDAVRHRELTVFPTSSLIIPATGILSVTLGGHVGKIDSLRHLRMAAPAKKTELTQIGGVDLKRFVTHSTLLALIDPVRGEPTRASPDENPDANISGGLQLMQKFLDSFALICSTSSSGAETASAVCLEHAPAGSILRVARNRGLTPKDLIGLEEVLKILRVVAEKGACFTKHYVKIADASCDAEMPSTQAEREIILRVVELDRGRILSMAEKVEKSGIRNFIREAYPRLTNGQVRPGTSAKPGLRLWLDNCPFTAAPLQTWSPATMAVLIDWASQARWVYPEQLQSLFKLDGTQKSAWLDSLHKIARYRSAIKSMVKFAVKQPEVLEGIHIREVEAPNPSQFFLPNEKAHLQEAVRNLVGKDSGFVLEQLEKHLGTQDVEAKLRRACRLKLTLHSEMQLVTFYEANPSLSPRMRFIGTSKKACFLCHEYLLQHPLKLQVSASHQKIYPSWMPPPYYRVPGKFKSTPFGKLSKTIEQLTRRELKTALTAPRRPRNQDSTAGPSLTITATVPSELV